MKHPNQSFIDNINRPVKSDDRTPVYFYSSQYTEKKRKEKFSYFVESLNNPRNSKNDSLTKAIAKIFDYNTLSKNQNKVLLEAKQSVGSLPQQFNYNGLVYAFNQELNMFVNQHGHAISIEQATAFMEMAQLEEVGSFTSESDTDGGAIALPSVIPGPPEAPTGLTATNIGIDDVTLSWQDNSTTETEFKIYYAEETVPVPATPSGLTLIDTGINGVTLAWNDNSINETEFKIYYRT
jgi:hypothetical protein